MVRKHMNAIKWYAKETGYIPQMSTIQSVRFLKPDGTIESISMLNLVIRYEARKKNAKQVANN